MENQSKNYLISSSRNILAAKFNGGRLQIDSNYRTKVFSFVHRDVKKDVNCPDISLTPL